MHSDEELKILKPIEFLSDIGLPLTVTPIREGTLGKNVFFQAFEGVRIFWPFSATSFLVNKKSLFFPKMPMSF